MFASKSTQQLVTSDFEIYCIFEKLEYFLLLRLHNLSFPVSQTCLVRISKEFGQLLAALAHVLDGAGRVVLDLKHDGHAAFQSQDYVAAVRLFRQKRLTPVHGRECLAQGVQDPVLALLPPDHGRLHPLLVDGADDLL